MQKLELIKKEEKLAAGNFAGSLCSADAAGARSDRKGGACFRWAKAGN